jgi:hypothetical protein
MVMSDQRCLYSKLFIYPTILLTETLLTQTSSNYEISISEIGTALIASTHLLSKYQSYRIPWGHQ